VLYYSYNQIVLQEVPDEISLGISISGCPLKCKGCHSPETWNPNFGKQLTETEFNQLLSKNPFITCVCFFGGEWNSEYLLKLIQIAKSKNLKICLYTGLELDDLPKELIQELDYVKTGRYIEELGGLKSPNTNQKFIKLNNSSNSSNLQ